MRLFSSSVGQYPMGYTQFFAAVDFMIGPAKEIVIAGNPDDERTQAMIASIHRRFLPNKVLLLRPEGAAGQKISDLSPFVAEMRAINGEPAAYLCAGYACKAPLTEIVDLNSALQT
jgi:uncharacterized protein YyaL (SSP411 family)